MKNSKKGIAMLIVVSFILMLLILGGGVLMVSTGHFGTSFYQVKRARAYHAAEAAIQRVLWGCHTGAPGFQNLETIVAGTPRSFSHTVTDPDYSFGVDIKIYAINDLPLGVGIPTPANTYPVIATVDY